VNKNRSLLDLVYKAYGSGSNDAGVGVPENNDSDAMLLSLLLSSSSLFPRDSMIVHCLDIDTSGTMIFAWDRASMSMLHSAFQDRTGAGANEAYEALLKGWLDINQWMDCAQQMGRRSGKGNAVIHYGDNATDLDYAKDGNDAPDTTTMASCMLGRGKISLSLQRNHKNPPFMWVSTPESKCKARLAVKDLNNAGYSKLTAKRPKPSTTQFRILSHKHWMEHPVTKVKLIPITRWMHELCMHCAVMRHRILGDPVYGLYGKAHLNGGFVDDNMSTLSPTCARSSYVR
jgi:23S rRNA-/tRNA-specific pseudouridylate synthase